MFNKIKESISVKKAIIGANLIYIPTKEDVLVAKDRFISKNQVKFSNQFNKAFKDDNESERDYSYAKTKDELNIYEDVIFPKHTKSVDKAEVSVDEIERKEEPIVENQDINTKEDVDNILEDFDVTNDVEEPVDDDNEGDIDLIINLAHKIEDDELLNDDIRSLLNNSLMYNEDVDIEMTEYDDFYDYDIIEVNDDNYNDFEYENKIVIEEDEIIETIDEPINDNNIDEPIECISETVVDNTIEESKENITKELVDHIEEEKTTLNLEAIRELIVKEELELKKMEKTKKKTTTKPKTKPKTKVVKKEEDK